MQIDMVRAEVIGRLTSWGKEVRGRLPSLDFSGVNLLHKDHTFGSQPILMSRENAEMEQIVLEISKDEPRYAAALIARYVSYSPFTEMHRRVANKLVDKPMSRYVFETVLQCAEDEVRYFVEMLKKIA